jgi:hypothetical protein
VGTTIQQRPTTTPETQTQQKEKYNSGQSDWDIDMNRKSQSSNSVKKSHYQLQPTSRSPHSIAKTPGDKDVRVKMPSSPLAPSSSTMTYTELVCSQARLATATKKLNRGIWQRGSEASGLFELPRLMPGINRDGHFSLTKAVIINRLAISIYGGD